ncbi:hypothetical protein B0H17DRAFT_1213402 [Mycena rosella]|uniref:Uncharacterized protein n=1 Tax=Mycena rosella TaxID=1033263 RepID=A0AAD7CQY6_MYCRO|nr:hypothetical protein B0H17DRAFT_1213402 [Mycena rosella]
MAKSYKGVPTPFLSLKGSPSMLPLHVAVTNAACFRRIADPLVDQHLRAVRQVRHAPESDWLDGFPRVALHGDTLADCEVALRWIYHSEYAVEELLSRWPSDVLHMRLTALPHAAKAIALACECALPEILPATYALSIQKFSCAADGGRSHLVLAPDDLRRLLSRCEALQEALVRILIDPLGADTRLGAVGYQSAGTDAPHAVYWHACLAPDARAPHGTWLVRALDAMLRDDAFGDTLCADCRRAHLGTVRWRLERLHGGMARFFLLG